MSRVGKVLRYLHVHNDHDDVDSEIQIFQNALEFSEVKAREVMVPRTEITSVDISDSIL